MSEPSPRRRVRFWTLLVVLAPVAALAGASLVYRYSTQAMLSLQVSRQDVLVVARTLATTRGIDVRGWRELVDLEPQNLFRHYLSRTSPANREAIEKMARPVTFRAFLYEEKSAGDLVKVRVDPEGRLLSYAVPPPRSATQQVPESASRDAALAELRKHTGEEAKRFQLAGSTVEKHAATGSEIRRFRFQRRYDNDLSLEAVVGVVGTTPVGFEVSPRFAPGYAARFPALRPSWSMTRGFFLSFVVLAAFIYVITRFVKRLREQEIPVARSVIVAVLLFVSIYAASMLNSNTQRMASIERGATPAANIEMIMMAVMSLLMAAALGMTWGACEADVRESYPEKLHSTDALLAGHLSALAVRSSLATGLIFACYAILLTGLESWLRSTLRIWSPVGAAELIPFFGSRPTMSVLLTSVAGVPMIAGLFLSAVSVTHIAGRTRRARLLLCIVVLTVAMMGTFGNYSVAAWILVAGTVVGLNLLVPFLAGDLLALFVTSIASAWAFAASSLLAQPASAFRNAGWTLLVLLLAAIAGGALVAFRRREELTGDARPEYARNIAERLTLTADLNTAREAQLRVMPRVVPSISDITLALRHSKEDRLATDYCEFFTSDSHVAIAVVDARLPGLSSALCISMLKGLLLNYSSRLDDAEEITRRVKKQHDAVFGENLPLTLFYGLLDRRTGAFHYDTLGDAPLPSRVRDGEASIIGRARTTIEHGDILVVHTEGLLDPGTSISDALSGQPAEQNVARLLEMLARRAERTERADPDAPRSWTVVGLARIAEAAH
jgi:hypothetical protein